MRVYQIPRNNRCEEVALELSPILRTPNISWYSEPIEVVGTGRVQILRKLFGNYFASISEIVSFKKIAPIL